MTKKKKQRQAGEACRIKATSNAGGFLLAVRTARDDGKQGIHAVLKPVVRHSAVGIHATIQGCRIGTDVIGRIGRRARRSRDGRTLCGEREDRAVYGTVLILGIKSEVVCGQRL